MKEDLNKLKAGVEGTLDDVPMPNGIKTREPEEDIPELPETQMMDGGLEAPSPGEDMQVEGEEPSIQYQGFKMPEMRAPAPVADVNLDKLHEVAEAIVNERFDELASSMGNYPIWKEKVETNIISIKQEIIRLHTKIENLNNAILGKVKDYDNSMRDVYTEMKALERVFGKILEPMTENIKELDRITKEMKRDR